VAGAVKGQTCQEWIVTRVLRAIEQKSRVHAGACGLSEGPEVPTEIEVLMERRATQRTKPNSLLQLITAQSTGTAGYGTVRPRVSQGQRVTAYLCTFLIWILRRFMATLFSLEAAAGLAYSKRKSGETLPQ
jgi:hypothetical protein